MHNETIVEEAIALINKALILEHQFIVKHCEDYDDDIEYYSFSLEISMNEVETDDGPYILPEPVIVEISYDHGDFCFITGEDHENDIASSWLYRYMFFSSALKPKEGGEND